MDKLADQRAGRRSALHKREQRALIFLAQVAVLVAGYDLLGTRGWVHADDLHSLAGPYGWPGVLMTLEEKGLATALEVSATPASVFLYRITQKGMNEVGKRLSEPAPVVHTPTASEDGHFGVYLSSGLRWALLVLRERYPGWVSVEDVRKAADSWNRSGKLPYRFGCISDVTALALAGYAESDRSGDRSAPVYRISDVGRTTHVLEWHGYDPEAEMIYSEHDGRRLLTPSFGISFFGSGN